MGACAGLRPLASGRTRRAHAWDRIGPFEVESAALVVLRNGYEPSAELERALQEHVKTETAPYEYPRRLEFVESLPKTPGGKIRRAELRRG